MKRIIQIVCSLCLFLTLAACGNSRQKEVEDTLDQYLRAVQSGDVQKACSYYDTSFTDTTGLSSLNMQNMRNEDMKAFIQTVYQHSIREYSIKDISVEKDLATATVEIQGVDLATAYETTYEEDLQKAVSEYMKDNEESLNELLQKEGESAVKEKIATDVTSDLLKVYTDKIVHAKSEPSTVTIKLKRIKDEWKLISQSQ